ncbi:MULTISPECIES: NUDIX hydrolase [Streptomyces]|uniref:NUDIX hydrolase n=1 Tax=Streptomyces TaxID=1883 RepID=UPI00163BCFB0|nr:MULTISPECIES: NUDIX hydrolase [Streptomyces]MBC2876132.1 NUDIX hydrolase [Streptomyces sp. TYQ1024]UBI38489.1 NUDIX hydrolase [Streptomyces mobaraensis]UKW31073.1 NUDIX hydrolase [Streptomyces sp. TYQ1024]
MPPASHVLGLAHLTDAAGRLLMLKTEEGGWRLPGGPALPEETAQHAMAYYVRRDLRVRIMSRFLLGMEPVNARSTAFLFACAPLTPDDIARIKLPSARSDITAYAFVDYPGITEGSVADHEHRLIVEANDALRGTG